MLTILKMLGWRDPGSHRQKAPPRDRILEGNFHGYGVVDILFTGDGEAIIIQQRETARQKLQ